jgi:hypothetical protein
LTDGHTHSWWLFLLVFVESISLIRQIVCLAIVYKYCPSFLLFIIRPPLISLADYLISSSYLSISSFQKFMGRQQHNSSLTNHNIIIAFFDDKCEHLMLFNDKPLSHDDWESYDWSKESLMMLRFSTQFFFFFFCWWLLCYLFRCK